MAVRIHDYLRPEIEPGFDGYEDMLANGRAVDAYKARVEASPVPTNILGSRYAVVRGIGAVCAAGMASIQEKLHVTTGDGSSVEG